jgi:hypothetical protein
VNKLKRFLAAGGMLVISAMSFSSQLPAQVSPQSNRAEAASVWRKLYSKGLLRVSVSSENKGPCGDCISYPAWPIPGNWYCCPDGCTGPWLD